jgi:tetratricopeptide (TPR) repeat protein
MRWPRWCFLAAGAGLLACAPPPAPARPVARSPARPAATAAPWPDVARDARSEKGGARDAAVVVAVERRGAHPHLAGVRVSGEDWVRFFPNVLGVPSERVTALFDAAATRSAISSAVRATSTRVATGGRLWFVAIGYAVVSEADIASAAAATPAQVISVLDVVPESAAELAPPAASRTRPLALPPITFSISSPTPLPGASRPALSYLLMGALRGWGDRDHDGRVTAGEAAAYLDLTLRLLTPRGSSRRGVSARTELVCSELTTLSVAREPAPNVIEIAPRVPPVPHADPERLAVAHDAVRAVDTQLAMALASGSLEQTAVLGGPRFTGEGDQRRVEVVPMPNQVAATLRVRLDHAQRLGGAAVPEAAPLLVEAGGLSLAYGQLDEGKRMLTPVLEARCGVDAAGYQAWQSLLAMSAWTNDGKNAARLVSMDCAFDEASASAIDALLRPVRSPDDPNQNARQLYNRAEQESDATLSRCTWSAAAEKYAQSWWSDPEQLSQVEPALNGADALRKLGRRDEAVALYRSYIQKQGGPAAGESDSRTKERRSYAFAACSSYLALARTEGRFFPGYFDTCGDVSCKGLDPSTCRQARLSAEVHLLDSAASELDHPRRLSVAARDREELAGWELTETARVERLREASERYADAEAAWGAIVDRGEATPDPAEAARRRAEAAVRHLGVELELGAEVTEESVENARKLARWARDVSADERRAEPARLLVELADGLLAREHRIFGTSQGQRGIAPRFEVRFEGERDKRHYVRDEVPLAVAAAIAARDEYLASVPATFDAGRVRYRMAYEAGRLQFLYGHFAEARQRLELPYAIQCGVSPIAHEAWVLLLSVANLESDITRSKALAADAAICPSDVETRIHSNRLRKPARGILVLEGRTKLQAAEALPDGPQRRALRREAAAIFRQFIDEAPDRDEAPEAAWLAAELYAELEENARALEMYRRFIDRYASEAHVRVTDIEKGYAALATLHARLGDYRAAARALVEQSEQKRLPAKTRAAAAHKARELRKDRDGRGLRSPAPLAAKHPAKPG